MCSASSLFAALAGVVLIAGPGLAGAPGQGPRTELIGLRSECSKTYLLPDGQYESEIHAGVIHVPDENGGWQDLETDDIRYCTTATEQYWTGHILRDNTGNYKNNGTMEIREGRASGNDQKRQSWARFDISNIPDGATIASVMLQYFTQLVDGSPVSNIRFLSVDPIPTDASPLYDAIYNGTLFDTLSGHATNEWGYRYFNATGRQTFQDRLPLDWIAIGIQSPHGTNAANFARMAGYNGGTYKPYLTVTYSPPPVDDVCADDVISPNGVVPPDTTITPYGVWSNLGNRVVGFDAWLCLTDPSGTRAYAERVQVQDLDIGASDTIEFPIFNLGLATGNWIARCSTFCIGDINPSNNVLDEPFVVSIDGRSIDVGAVAIVAPTRWVDTSTTVTPTATWVNNTGFPVNFTAWCMIANDSGPVYSRIIPVTAMPALAETTLFFEDINTGQVSGTWTMTCSTFCSGDTVTTNDAVHGVFSVLGGGRPPWHPGWYEVQPMPAMPSGRPVKRGGWMAIHEGTGHIYAGKGNKSFNFYRYDPLGDTWYELAEIPAGRDQRIPDKGTCGISDGINTVYMVKGNNSLGFYSYDIAADTWTQLPDVTVGRSGKAVKGGTDVQYVVANGTPYVYLLKGYKTDFQRYNCLTREWQDLSPAPIGIKEKWDKGSFIVYDGDATIYAQKAKYADLSSSGHEFWKYDIYGDTWYTNRLTGMPLNGLHAGRIKSKKSKDGADGAWHDNHIYALKGGNTQQFFRYDVEGDSWHEIDTMPSLGSTGKKRRVKHGADIVSYGGGAFFALKGNKTFETWRYVVPEETLGLGGPQSGVITTGLDADRALTVAPNPLAGRAASVAWVLPVAGPARLTVYDALGRCRHEQSFIAERRGVLSADLRSLGAGVYLLKLETQQRNLVTKLVVKR